MVTRRLGMISTGIWIPEKLLKLAKEQDPDFNLSHYVAHQLQRDFEYAKTSNEVNDFLEKIEIEE